MPCRFLRSVRTAVVAAGAALALAAPPPLPASAVPGFPAPRPVGELLIKLQSLYLETEEATEAYNATEEELKQQQGKVRELDAQLAKARTQLTDGRNDAGRLAREQYRQAAGSLSPSLNLLLSRHPQQVLDQGHLLQRAAERRLAVIDRLARNERRLNGLTTRARAAFTKQQALEQKKRRQRDAVQAQLDEVERLIVAMSPAQLEEIGRLERQRAEAAQRAFMGSGALGAPPSAEGAAAGAGWTPSESGSRAVAYAIQQIGTPYEPGAEGPGSFDSSGLTSQAWAHAGRQIPRTSRGQWRRLPKVPLRRLRPGDLVVYFKKASHVALYIGNGLVVQAPRPGMSVRVSPIAANPLRGAVRPDEGEEPLSTYYGPPELPEGAEAGDDTDY